MKENHRCTTTYGVNHLHKLSSISAQQAVRSCPNNVIWRDGQVIPVNPLLTFVPWELRAIKPHFGKLSVFKSSNEMCFLCTYSNYSLPYSFIPVTVNYCTQCHVEYSSLVASSKGITSMIRLKRG